MHPRRTLVLLILAGCVTPTGDVDFREADFLPRPDVGGQFPSCDLWAQNCPEGEKCSWVDAGGIRCECFPVAAEPGSVGDPCTVEVAGPSGQDTCERGTTCFYGTCFAICEGDESNPICPDRRDSCRIDNDSHVWRVCLPGCDPLAAECPDGFGCYPRKDKFACSPRYGPPKEKGGACDPYYPRCENGEACILGELVPGCMASACCTPHCSLDDPECEDGTECVPWYPDVEAPPGLSYVGVCIHPE